MSSLTYIYVRLDISGYYCLCLCLDDADPEPELGYLIKQMREGGEGEFESFGRLTIVISSCIKFRQSLMLFNDRE